MAEISSDLIYEILKALQREATQTRSEMGELKQQMHASQLSQNAIRQEIVGVHTELSGIHATLVRHGHQLDRIERRLELNDTPTLTA